MQEVNLWLVHAHLKSLDSFAAKASEMTGLISSILSVA
jgi:hypothetical protein